MTSPVSAIEAIERFERAVRANGYRTCDDHTEAEYQAAKADVLALARQAEALQRENAEKNAEIAKLRGSLSEILETAEQYWANPAEISEITRARALLGESENAGN